jgi:hypothetical protein
MKITGHLLLDSLAIALFGTGFCLELLRSYEKRIGGNRPKNSKLIFKYALFGGLSLGAIWLVLHLGLTFEDLDSN